MAKSKISRIPVVFWVVTVVFAVYALGIIFPLLFAFNSALKDGDMDFLMNMSKVTLKPNFMNFIDPTSIHC